MIPSLDNSQNQFLTQETSLNKGKYNGDLKCSQTLVLNNVEVAGEVSSVYARVNLLGGSSAGTVSSGENIFVNQSVVKGTSNAGVNFTAKQSTVGDINAKNEVTLITTRAGNISGNSYVTLSNGSTCLSINSNISIIMDSQVMGAIDCKGNALIKSSGAMSLNCGGELSIKNSTIQGDVEVKGELLTCRSTFIRGTLKCNNFATEIISSTVDKIVIEAPSKERLTDYANLASQLLELKINRKISLRSRGITILNEEKSYKTKKYKNHPLNFMYSSDLFTTKDKQPANGSRSWKFDNNIRFQAKSKTEMMIAIELARMGCVAPEEVENERQIVILRDSSVKHIVFEKPGGVVWNCSSSTIERIEAGKVIEI